jgi:hypothetical protein
MSKTRFKDIKHFFTVTPDNLEVKGFADGVEGTLQLSWQHPMLHTDEDDEQPAEGTNHIRIEVKTEWLPFDTDNIPEAKKGWCLLINRGSFAQCYNPTNEFWLDDECNSLTESKDFFKGMPYKLVPLS